MSLHTCCSRVVRSIPWPTNGTPKACINNLRPALRMRLALVKMSRERLAEQSAAPCSGLFRSVESVALTYTHTRDALETTWDFHGEPLGIHLRTFDLWLGLGGCCLLGDSFRIPLYKCLPMK